MRDMFEINKSLFWIITLCSLLPYLSSSSLYSPDDRLWEFDSFNFPRIAYDKNIAWVIEFYNEWCGHCMRFAPDWKEFAKDTENWKNVIEVGVVNCIDPDNTKLCRQYEVAKYPTIKFFPPYMNGTEQGRQFEGDRDLWRIRHEMIDFLQSLPNIPQQWPSLQPLKAYSIWDFFDKTPSDVDSAYIFIENTESYLGREIILDFSTRKSIVLHRLTSNNTALLHELVNNFENSSKGQLVKISRNGRKEVLSVFDGTMQNTVVRDLVYEILVGEPRVKSRNGTDDNKEDLHEFKGIYMPDLENAVASALRQEVSVHPYISGASFTALKNFTTILKLYFPGRPVVVNFLAKLSSWMDSRKGNLTGERFETALNHLETENSHLPSVGDWYGCRGSQPKFRGYNCGLWSLFHTLTVQAYSKYDLQQGGDSLNPLDVLFAMRGYITHFFSCEGCSKHFQQMSADLENEATTPKDTVLWLWRAHNKVNKRLAGDETEDPRHLKIQFPSEESCDKCRFKNNGKEIEWDEKAVLRYLQHYYKKENIKPLPENQLMRADDITGDGNRVYGNSLLLSLYPMYRFIRPF